MQVEEQLPILIVTDQVGKITGPLNDLSFLLAALGYIGEDGAWFRAFKSISADDLHNKDLSKQNFQNL